MAFSQVIWVQSQMQDPDPGLFVSCVFSINALLLTGIDTALCIGFSWMAKWVHSPLSYLEGTYFLLSNRFNYFTYNVCLNNTVKFGQIGFCRYYLYTDSTYIQIC